MPFCLEHWPWPFFGLAMYGYEVCNNGKWLQYDSRIELV